MVGHYDNFFIASAGASAAILGLLVVAVTVNADDSNTTTRERRTVLAGSAFVAPVEIFIVSIVALTGGSVAFGLPAWPWLSSACCPPGS